MIKNQPFGNSLFIRFLAGIYFLVVSFRNLLYDKISWLSTSVRSPVISIGNIHAGGTGKTPVSLLVGNYFSQHHVEIAFLSRGYRRKNNNKFICKPGDTAHWQDAGDEPAMLHSHLPNSWLGIGPNRLKSIAEIQPQLLKKSIFILDDGFQHRKVRRDADIICLPPDPFSDSLLPAGMLREPITSLKRASCVLIIGTKNQESALNETRISLLNSFPNLKVFILFQIPIAWIRLSDKVQVEKLPFFKAGILCGIARPQRFLDLVNSQGIYPIKHLICKDHHVFTYSEIQKFCLNEIEGIITTEKDAFRIDTIKLVNCPDIWYLRIGLVFSDFGHEKEFYSYLSGLMTL